MVAVLLIAAASIVMLLWIRRIGRNAGLFGGWLVLASVFPWDRFAYVGGATADLTVVQVRVTVGLLIGLGSVLLFRRRVVVLTWRAGRMPAPIIAELTWIISFLGQVLVSVALLQVVFSAEEYSTPFVRGYRFGDPNTTMIMVGLLCIGASAACWLAELIAVTISQHLAIVEERRASPQPA